MSCSRDHVNFWYMVGCFYYVSIFVNIWVYIISGFTRDHLSIVDYFTIVTWGAMVQKCIDAIKILNLEIGEADLIDIRTLNPIDWETIYGSVKKTGKLLIVHEDLLTGGIGAEISARVSDNLFEDLDGPIKRVAAKDCHVPYSDFLESQVLPQTEEIVDAINDLMEY